MRKLRHFAGRLFELVAAVLVLNGTRPTAGQTLSFFRTTPGMDPATAVATDASGIYVIGNGLRKYDSLGNELWTRGLSGPGFGVAADASGVYVVGSAQGPTGRQSVLRKYTAGGNELWTRPLERSEERRVGKECRL